MKFYFGLYDSGKYWDTGDMTWEVEDNKYVIVSKDKNRYFLEKMYSFFWVFSLNTLKKRIWCILYNVSFVWGISEDNHIKIDHSSHFLSFGFVIFVCVYKL